MGRISENEDFPKMQFRGKKMAFTFSKSVQNSDVRYGPPKK